MIIFIKLLFQLIPNYTLTRNGAFYGLQMAEYVLGYIIARERNFFEMKEFQQQSLWYATFCLPIYLSVYLSIHSFIPDISIAPLQVNYYSDVLPTQHGYCVS